MKIQKSALLVHLRHLFLRHRDSGPVKVFVVFGFVAIAAFALNARASHFYDNERHWPRARAPLGTELPIKIYDNISSEWDGALRNAVSQWGKSSTLSTKIYNQGGTTKIGRCLYVGSDGYITVCSANDGDTGYLGLARTIVETRSGHILRASAHMNDFYFNDPDWVKARTNDWTTLYAWRKNVMCHELGHTLGLRHQDENLLNENLGSCMDYTNAPTGSDPNVPPGTVTNFGFLSNLTPDDHDYEVLGQLYRHTDITATPLPPISPTYLQSRDVRDVFGKGTPVEKDAKGRTTLYKRDLGGGFTEFTHVDYID